MPDLRIFSVENVHGHGQAEYTINESDVVAGALQVSCVAVPRLTGNKTRSA